MLTPMYIIKLFYKHLPKLSKYDPAILFLGIYPTEMSVCLPKNIYKTMNVHGSFVIEPKLSQKLCIGRLSNCGTSKQ